MSFNEISRNINTMITSNKEKKNFAEYPTPYVLRKEMINSVPIYFWKNKNRKVLEPCCGKGGFLIDVIAKFMKYLDIPFEERYQHIVENILYFGDINSKNVNICRKILGNYDLNYFIGDTLEMDLKGFDLVVGNPPYNNLGIKETGNTLYQKFIKKALIDWLNPKGFLLFVTPPAWRKPMSEHSKNYGMYDLMTRQNHMIYLEIHDAKDGKETFDAHTRYDWYLIQKKNPREDGKFLKTEVIGEDGNKQIIDLSKFPWLPNFDFRFIQKLFAKPGKKTVDVIGDLRYHTKKPFMSKRKTKNYRFVCVHGTPKKGLSFYYSSSDQHGHFKVPKVIFGNTSVALSFIDEKGEYCITEHAIGIIDTPKNMEKILRALQSPKMRELLKACLWSTYQIDWRIFLSFKKDFYKEFL